MDLLVEYDSGKIYEIEKRVDTVVAFIRPGFSIEITSTGVITKNPIKPRKQANFKPDDVIQEPVTRPELKNRILEQMTPEYRLFYILYNAWLKSFIRGLNWASKLS